MPPPGSGPANFTSGEVHRHLIRLAGFGFMGFAAMTLASLIETIYLGIVGTAELAAISFTFPVVMVLQSIAMGLGIGASSIIARTLGAGDRDQVRRLVTHTLVLAVLVLLAFCTLGRLYAREIFTLLGAEGEILDLVVQYMNIWFFALPTFALSMIGTGLLRAVGNAAMPGIVMTLGSALQIMLGPLLIFGWAGLPALGLEGAALSFLISRVISFTLCFYVLIRREQLLTTSLQGLTRSWRSILHVGLPAMATNLIMPVSMAVITRLLASHGPTVIAGFGVGSKIDAMAAMIVFAVSSSLGPFIGQNWGGGKFDRVDHALSLSYRFVMVWGLVSATLMFIFGDDLIALINDDPAVVESAHWYLMIVPGSLAFMGVLSVASSCFNATGKPMPPLVISIARMLVVYVPMAIVFDMLWGYIGIFIATTASTILLALAGYIWNRRHLDHARRVREAAREPVLPEASHAG
ncbi:MAG: MATE family efflux transporter [Pseudomonadales bacterium]|nr:MATE family efflux transporter [Pseudomonadales bacterium]